MRPEVKMMHLKNHQIFYIDYKQLLLVIETFQKWYQDHWTFTQQTHIQQYSNIIHKALQLYNMHTVNNGIALINIVINQCRFKEIEKKH